MIALLLLSSAFAADPVTHLAWRRSGVDSLGRSAYQRVEFDETGVFEWVTAARGGDCSTESGAYEATLPPADRAKLASAAARLVDEQGEKPGKPQRGASSIETRLSLTQTDSSGRSHTRLANPTKATPAWEAFEDVLAELKARAKPRSAVSFSGRRANDRETVVTFKHEGTEPYLLTLPADAKHGFHAGAGTLSYARKPEKLAVRLSAERPTFSVTLRGVPREAELVEFSNLSAREHAPHNAVAGVFAPPEAALCAKLRDR